MVGLIQKNIKNGPRWTRKSFAGVFRHESVILPRNVQEQKPKSGYVNHNLLCFKKIELWQKFCYDFGINSLSFQNRVFSCSFCNRSNLGQRSFSRVRFLVSKKLTYNIIGVPPINTHARCCCLPFFSSTVFSESRILPDASLWKIRFDLLLV